MILKEAARFTLAISVFGIALRTPREDRRLLRPVGLLLAFGMLIMWLVSAGLAWSILGLSPLMALLLAAVVTPTDPVVASSLRRFVASSIVTGGLAERSLPDRLRSTLSLESGANDGLAYLIVLLRLLLIESGSPSVALERWLADILLVAVLLAILVGAAIGYVVAFMLHYADRIRCVEEHSMLGLSVALSLGGGNSHEAPRLRRRSRGLHGRRDLQPRRGSRRRVRGTERPRGDQQALQPANHRRFRRHAALARVVRPRLGGSFLCHCDPPPAPPARSSRDRPRSGAGPAGRALSRLVRADRVAANYYALLAKERMHDPFHWHVASLVIVVSILAHGVTSAPALAAGRRASAA